MFGKLTWDAIPFDQPIPLFAGAIVVVVILGVLAFVAIKGWIPYLWREWITSVDHKRIGVMYVTLAAVMLLVRAIGARHRLTIWMSAIGLVAILAAGFAGLGFAGNGAAGASLGMSLAFAVSLAAYVVLVFALPSSAPKPPSSTT